ncbi:dynein heavy chain domain-containing protein 1 [Polyodon spathula]|uniref:dynein heavy chain domain-containing protein 1 n=1 Tax=Polyodon spathula TaxID=7913 RepID=UPI001B7F72D6|nr:dynein heavy chain domain-containing protein 1 [Polyodon spathula]
MKPLPPGCTAVPEYERYVYLVDVLLHSGQPAMLVGESGVGKTTLCQALLRRNQPHLRLPISPCFGAAYLRSVLESRGCPNPKPSPAYASHYGTKNPSLQLFIDDIHAASCDAVSKVTPVLETLRQCMTMGGVPSPNGLHFRLFNSGALNYLVTCTTPIQGTDRSCISSRLSRLFSVLALPCPTNELLVSIYSSRIQLWLKDFPAVAKFQVSELSICIIEATFDLYTAVKERFQSSTDKPYLLFFFSDIEKVFNGMFLMAPRATQPLSVNFNPTIQVHNSTTTAFTIARLWIHESFRTFGDRLSKEHEMGLLACLLADVSKKYFYCKGVVSLAAEQHERPTRPKEHQPSTPQSKEATSERSGKPAKGQLPLSEHEEPSSQEHYPDSGFQQDVSANVLEEASTIKRLTASSQRTGGVKGVDSSDEQGNPSLENPQEPEECTWEKESEGEIRNNFSTRALEGLKEQKHERDKDSENCDSSELKEPMMAAETSRQRSEVSESVPAPLLLLQPFHSKQEKPHGTDPLYGKNSPALSRRGKKGKEFKSGVVPQVQSQGPKGPFVPLHLLQGIETTLEGIIFSSDLYNSPVQQNLGSLKKSLYQEKDLGAFAKQLSAAIQWRQQDGGKGSVPIPEFAICREGVCQLAHIYRALLLPGGHAALFGLSHATGRQTVARMAVHLTSSQLFEVKPGGTLEERSEVRNVLKDASFNAGILGESTVILVHEGIGGPAIDDLLAVMAEGTFPGLYTKHELSDVVQKLTAATRNTRRELKPEQLLERYYRQVQRNLHVLLLLSVIQERGENDGSQKTAQPSPSSMARLLKLCCSVEIYQSWSIESLTEVASSRLLGNNLPPGQESKDTDMCSLTDITRTMAWIHQSSLRYAAHLTPKLSFFSLQTFLDFIDRFHTISAQLSQNRDRAQRLRTALARLNESIFTAEKYRVVVESLRQQFAVALQLQEQYQQEMASEKANYRQARLRSLQVENVLSQLYEQLEQTQAETTVAANEVSPMYQAALNALQSLKVQHVEEIRSYRVPPEKVCLVTDALCLMFGKPMNWESTKQLIGQNNFFQNLEFYDKCNIPNALLEALGKFINNPEFKPEVIRDISQPAEALCLWVCAVYQYGCLLRQKAQKLARLHKTEKLIAETRAKLNKERMLEETARESFEEAGRLLDKASQHLEELTQKQQQAEIREQGVQHAAQLVKGYIIDWTAKAEEAEQHLYTVQGDALLLAAAASYLGPFKPSVRKELLWKWKKLCRRGEINLNPEDPRQEIFNLAVPPMIDVPAAASIIPVREEIPLSKIGGRRDNIPQDLSDRLIVQLLLRSSTHLNVRQWPLLVNSDLQGECCIEAALKGYKPHLKTDRVLTGEGQNLLQQTPSPVQERFPDTLLVVTADDPTLDQKLLQGANQGQAVLVTSIERGAHSLLLQELIQRQACPGSIREACNVHPAFCLYLSTSLPMRVLAEELDSAFLKMVNVIDISLSQSGLEDLILKEVVLSECPEIWEKRRTMQRDIMQQQDSLQQAEDSLMDYIIQSSTPLLKDPNFVLHVKDCQKRVEAMHMDLQELTAKVQEHTILLKEYEKVAKLGVALRQALQEVSKLSPLYLFPLKPFVDTVKRAMVQGEVKTLRRVWGEATVARLTEITHRIVAQVLDSYRPCLFQSHASLFQLLVSVALIMHSGDCTTVEWRVFLKGLKDIANSPNLPSLPKLPLCWLSENAWREIALLEHLPAFKGIGSSLLCNASQWQEYFKLPYSTVIGSVPCPSHAHLSALQRALLWKTLCPDRFVTVADDLAACQLGKAMAVEESGCMDVSARILTQAAVPVVFLMPGQGQMGPSTHPLYLVKQMARASGTEVSIRVISFGAQITREMLLQTLETSSRDGHWLVLDNCHLLDHWDSEVIRELTHLVCHSSQGNWKEVSDAAINNAPVASKSGGRQVHPQFRLWLITCADTPHAIPVVLKGCAMKLACDSPWDLRETLQATLRQAVGHLSSPADHVIRCVALHSVLLQRQSYREQGQGHVYSWTQEDLFAVLDAQEKIKGLCDNTGKALEYIAGSLVYGGHVEDNGDLEALQAVASTCLRLPAPLWRSGPHVLTDIIGGSGHCGISPVGSVLRSVEHRIQQLPSPVDPLCLGFSAGLAGVLISERSRTLEQLLLATQTPSVKQVSKSVTPDLGNCEKKLQALREALNWREGRKDREESGPMHEFLEQEWKGLITLISSLLTDLTRSRSHSNINNNKDPSQPPLQLLCQLESRLELLRLYLFGVPPTVVYNLSAFENPKGFLVALLQESALAEQRNLSEYKLHYQVLRTSTIPSSPPQTGAYLTGMELHNALWDTRLGAIQETLSAQPCHLPIVWIRGRADGPKRIHDSSIFPLYLCPVYLGTAKEKISLRDSNVITYIPLVAKLDPVLCKLRRVCVVSVM